jgi:aspartokinase
MSEYGAEVLHPKSVKFAQKSNVPIHVRSSFTNRTGTIVGGIKNCEYTVGPMEKLKVTSVIDSPKGIAYKINGSNAVISTITSKNVEQITVPVADIDQNIKQIYKTLQTI